MIDQSHSEPSPNEIKYEPTGDDATLTSKESPMIPDMFAVDLPAEVEDNTAPEAVHVREEDDDASDESHSEQVVSPAPGAERLALLEESVSKVLDSTQTFSARAEFYEGQLRHLQSRVESLQGDQIQQFLGPVMQRLAVLHTEATHSAREARERLGGSSAGMDFDYFATMVAESLDLMGAASVGAQEGDSFDRTMHAARKSVTTSDHSLDGLIGRVYRQGLIRHGAERAFLPAQVSVYRFQVPSPTVERAPTSVEAPNQSEREHSYEQ